MKSKANEKTILSIVILFLLCINLLPILTATAGPPPGKGKPGKGKPEGQTLEISFTRDITGTVPQSHSDLVDGLLTRTRAHASMGHVPPYNLDFIGSKFGDFKGTHGGRDLEIILEWNREGSGGSILYCFWFDNLGSDGDPTDDYKILDKEGAFIYLGDDTYEVVLDNAEILDRLGANTKGKNKYETLWGPDEVIFTFTLSYD
jgi:hypothetical protein